MDYQSDAFNGGYGRCYAHGSGTGNEIGQARGCERGEDHGRGYYYTDNRLHGEGFGQGEYILLHFTERWIHATERGSAKP